MLDRDLIDATQRARAMELSALKQLRAGKIDQVAYWELLVRARNLELDAINRWLERRGRLAA